MSRLGTALVAAVALLSVGACTGEEPADGDPSATPRVSATPSATSTPTPPPLPPEAREHSADGAAAFVEYFYRLINYAAATGEVAPLDAASEESCRACTRLIARYSKLYAAGGYSEDPGWTPRITSSQLTKGDFYVTVDVTTASYLYKPNPETSATRMKAGSYQDLFRLEWHGTGWAVELFMEQEPAK